MIAYAFRSGQIYMGSRTQEGTISLASGHPVDLDAALCRTAFISEDRSCFLVPGLAEATDDGDAIKAIADFANKFRKSLESASERREKKPKPEAPGHVRWTYESMLLAQRGLA